MTTNAWEQLLLYGALLMGLGLALSGLVAGALAGTATPLSRFLDPLERKILALAGTHREDEMTWSRYAKALLIFSAFGFLFLYALQRLQGVLPLNPEHLHGVTADLAFNTAISFVTNTNWQSYSGEATMSYLTQLLGLTVQNFLSAAVGMAVLAVLIRGFTRKESPTVGNFWVDLTRATLHVLLPLSMVLALLLVSQGVVQSTHGTVMATQIAPDSLTMQPLPLGPAASQIAIKQLGTNGGGFFNANSAHPFENPTPLSNLLELLAILLLPVSCIFAFGRLIHDRRQGHALFAAMTLIFIAALAVTIRAEEHGTSGLERARAALPASPIQPGGNMEGKEVRFGITNSALWAVATTAASNGSVNAMHDSFTPIGGLAVMVLMQLGEVVYGGVGSGLYGMLLFALVAVFIAGLMVGRTPEYLGKKIEAFDMKMAMLGILTPCLAVLVGTAIAVVLPAGRLGILNPGAHGFSEVLYAFSSAANNNGSAFGGLTTNTPFYNLLLGVVIFVGRFLIIVVTIALAGNLAAKKRVPVSAGTLPTHTPLFVTLLIGTVLLVGALNFVPALALGPVVEQLQMLGVGGGR